MDASAALRADVPVERSGAMTIAGRPLDVRVAANAVTDADLWLYDAATGVAVIGDLVTLPAPFFETACPARWQAALDEVWAECVEANHKRTWHWLASLWVSSH